MSEIVEFFTELMFGSGAWFGLLIILAIAFIVSYKAKYSSLVFIMILLFLGITYMDEVGNEISPTSMFVWAIIIDFVGVIILGLILARDLGFGEKR